MENNYETLRMPELKALTRERKLRGYSRLRKAELIAFLQDEDRRQEEPTTREPELEVPQPLAVALNGSPLTKRQLKRRRNKNSKLNKKFKNLSKEIDNLKSQIEGLENKIAKAAQSMNAGFKRKKIRSMKRDVVKAIEKLKESEKSFESIESRIPKNNNSKRSSSERIENKIAELNKKIRRAKNKKNKERLIAKRDSLKIELSWGPKELEGAFDGAYRRYRIDGIEEKGHTLDVETYFARTRKFLIDLLDKETMNIAVRSQATTWIRFVRDEVEQVSLAFNSRMMTVYSLNDKNEIVTAMIEHMAQQIENPALRNSKFVFDRVLHMDIDFHRLNLTRGSSYVPLPDWLMKKKAIINPKNSDMECFKWAVIAAMKWEEIDRDHQRVSKLKRYEGEFDWSGLEFPVSLRDINKFERNNEIGVNILAIENKKIYICRKGRDYNRIVNLMLIADVENQNKKHYVAVKSLSRLLSKQNSKHKEAQHFCTNCSNGFESEIIRDEHYEYCRSKDSVIVEMPTKNPIVKYADGQYQFKVPFVIYSDFESILVPVSGAANNPEMSSTRGINVHQPSGWCMYSKFAYGKVTNPLKQYRGRDCISKFCETIMVEAKRLYESAPKKPMDKLTKEQNVEFVTAKECHICFKKCSSKNRKVRDACHYTAKYRGAAHSSCNLRYRIPDYIPVLFHNLAGYDSHLFIKEFAKHTSKIGVIAKNTENYISFSVKVEVDKFIDKAGNEKSKEIELRFIYSFKFMSSSPDSLVNNLAKGGHEFWGFEKHDSKQKELIIRKGVYLYEYMDTWDKFEEKQLPSNDEFYSKLNMSGISEKDYQHACKVGMNLV